MLGERTIKALMSSDAALELAFGSIENTPENQGVLAAIHMAMKDVKIALIHIHTEAEKATAKHKHKHKH